MTQKNFIWNTQDVLITYDLSDNNVSAADIAAKSMVLYISMLLLMVIRIRFPIQLCGIQVLKSKQNRLL